MCNGEFTRGHLQRRIREKRARAADFPSCKWRGSGGRKNREKRDRARVCLGVLMMRLIRNYLFIYFVIIFEK
jgi:hypothetical protein